MKRGTHPATRELELRDWLPHDLNLEMRVPSLDQRLNQIGRNIFVPVVMAFPSRSTALWQSNDLSRSVTSCFASASSPLTKTTVGWARHARVHHDFAIDGIQSVHDREPWERKEANEAALGAARPEGDTAVRLAVRSPRNRDGRHVVRDT